MPDQHPRCPKGHLMTKENTVIRKNRGRTYRQCRRCYKLANRRYARKHYRQNKEKYRDKFLRYNYGITLEQYNAMLAAQDGKCFICGKSESIGLSVDHCHETKVVRRLLCKRCNTVIGLVEERLDILDQIGEYIHEYKVKTIA